MSEDAMARCCVSALVITFLVQGLMIHSVEGCQVNNGQFVQIYTVKEELAIGTTVGVLDLDNPASVKELRVSETNRYFTFNHTTREFRVQARVDVDGGLGVQTMLLSCVTQSGIELEIEVEFELEDVNDFSPSFTPSAVYNFSILETAVSGAQLGLIQANDGDIKNLLIEYSLLLSNHSNLFELKAIGGRRVALNLNGSLDYEKTRSYTLTVQARDCQQRSDCSIKQRSSTATVNVFVLDADDLNPEFAKERYQASISEDSEIGTLVVQVFARDQDELNEEILYSLTGDGSQYFSIDQASGRVTVSNAEGLVRDRDYLMEVKAYQANDETKRATVSLVLSILPMTGSVLKFTEQTYNVKVSESSPVDTAILTLTVRDTASSGPFYSTRQQSRAVEFSILQPTISAFKLVSSLSEPSAELVIAKLLDYENITEYEFTVRASDGDYEDTARVNVEILNDNDHNPVFDSDMYSFAVGWEENKFIGQIKATDKDQMDKLTYRVLSPYNRLFTVSSSGELYVAAQKSEFKKTSYALNVESLDSDRSPRKSTVIVYVTFNAGLEELSSPAGVIGSGSEAPVSEERLIIYIVAGVAGFLLIIVAIFVMCFLKRRAKRTARQLKQKSELKYTDTMTTVRSDDQNSCTPLQQQQVGGQQHEDIELQRRDSLTVKNRHDLNLTYKNLSEQDDLHSRSRQNNLSKDIKNTTPNTFSPPLAANNLPTTIPITLCGVKSSRGDSGRSSLNGDLPATFYRREPYSSHLHIKSPSMDDAVCRNDEAERHDNETKTHDEEVALTNMKNRRDNSSAHQGFISTFQSSRPDVTNIRAHEGPTNNRLASDQSLNCFITEVPVEFQSATVRTGSPFSNTSDYGSNTPTPEITSANNNVNYRQDLPAKNRELKARLPVRHQCIDSPQQQWGDKSTFTTFHGEHNGLNSLDPDRSVTPYSDASTEVDSCRSDETSGKPKLTIYF